MSRPDKAPTPGDGAPSRRRDRAAKTLGAAADATYRALRPNHPTPPDDTDPADAQDRSSTRVSRGDELALVDKGETPIEAFGLHPILAAGPAAAALLVAATATTGAWPALAAVFVFSAAWVRSYVGATPADTQLRRLTKRLRIVSIGHAVAFTLTFGGAWLATADDTTTPEREHPSATTAALLLAAQFLLHSLVLYLEWRADRLILGQRRATHRVGFINKEDEDVRYGKISTTGVKRRWWMRLVHAGIVVLDSDADNEALVASYGPVYKPMRVRGALLRAADQAANGIATGPYDPSDQDPNEPRA